MDCLKVDLHSATSYVCILASETVCETRRGFVKSTGLFFVNSVHVDSQTFVPSICLHHVVVAKSRAVSTHKHAVSDTAIKNTTAAFTLGLLTPLGCSFRRLRQNGHGQ